MPHRAFPRALAPLADPQRAVAMKAYLRGQFEFLGISTPQRRLTLRPLLDTFRDSPSRDLLTCAETLWQLPQREYQYAAVDLLARHRKNLSLRDLPRLLVLVQQRSWWDSVDSLAGVIGRVIRAEKEKGQPKMDAALRHRNLWVRRIAMIHQLGWREETDVARLFDYARALAPEPDFFIRKAIGWALRDYAWHDPKTIRKFLRQTNGILSPLSAREAAKHL